VLETFFNQSGTDTSYTVYAQIYTAYAWKSNPIHDGIGLAGPKATAECRDQSLP
jgi:hypothetical protein